MKRKEFIPRTKRLALSRSKGRCEATSIKYGLPYGIRCNASLAYNKPEYDHIEECHLAADNSLENCLCICEPCHKHKTALGTKERAKLKRLTKAHTGERKSVRDKPKPIWEKGRKIQSRPFQRIVK